MSAKRNYRNSDIMSRFLSDAPEVEVEEEQEGMGTLQTQDVDFREPPGIVEIPVDNIDPFPGHIFSVMDDDREMRILMSSIKEDGQQQPVIVRPKANGRFEMLAGHRRCRAMQLLGRKTLKAIINPVDNDQIAELIMMDTNAATREILPTERGEMYRRRAALIKELAREEDLSNWERLKLQESNDKYSQRNMYNYMALTRLTQDWKQLINSETVPLTVGIYLSELSSEDQTAFFHDLKGDYSFTIAQAKKIKDMVKISGYDTREAMEIIRRGEKPKRAFKKISLAADEIPSIYLRSCPVEEIKTAIIKDSVSWRTLIDRLGDRCSGMSNEDVLEMLLNDK